ncbi:hypothetical protein HAQ00_10050 [Acidithiobacillus caldus ATCC 51756]|uniref:hypothetical protein n=1 Tax=Acidithiobacillus caldus TaxID=33059 RepID=UPI001C077BF7|nr:hypothetical protein [Acidithiobacillus caldus]MBU2736056.1 hypothetical protein [Acidithiobacillus caldus ATCC 51756]MBU2801761.1 hypothetical protein [Acidithiobacillus caldus]
MDLETFMQRYTPHPGEEQGQHLGFLEGDEDWSDIPEGFVEVPLNTEDGARFWVSEAHLAVITALGSVVEVCTFDTEAELQKDVWTVMKKGRVTAH